MSRDVDRQRQFTRRAIMLAGGKTLLLSALAGRLYYLQVVEADRYRTLAEDNRVNIRLLPPPRGRIIDRTGRTLAVNRLDYRVVVVAEQANGVERTLEALGRIIAIAEPDHRRVLKDVRRKRRFVPVTVRENLTWEDVAHIEVNALDLPGIFIEEGQSRFYPYDQLLAHLLGYVAPVAEGDPIDDPLLELPGFRIGKSGVEKVYDLPLRGTGGRSDVEVNAVGRVIRELARKEGQAGAELMLSIDLDLQKFAYERFKDESGAAVVLDVRTGEILAMVSVPGFDPNVFSRGLTTEEWRALTTNPKAPLINKAIAGQYAPGSTYKPVVALAALEKGAISPQARVHCPGHMQLGDARFHCWRRGGHGSVDMRQAIVQSCDVYFYEVARRTGVDRISAVARRLGIGVPLGIDLPGEKPGLAPTQEWKQKALKHPWTTGETVVSGIGQGYVLATPLQLAVMTARIANGGIPIKPRLARAIGGGAIPGGPELGDSLRFNPQHLKIVHEGMVAVVNSASGTAKASAIRQPGREMAGKTGTSQVRRISRAERAAGVRKNEDLPWEKRDHALFIGYAPIDAPRFAVAVIVEHGGGGSKAAAPIARDILIEAQKLDSLRVAEASPAPWAKSGLRREDG
jgi:penicillin-binding protein 2